MRGVYSAWGRVAVLREMERVEVIGAAADGAGRIFVVCNEPFELRVFDVREARTRTCTVDLGPLVGDLRGEDRSGNTLSAYGSY